MKSRNMNPEIVIEPPGPIAKKIIARDQRYNSPSITPHVPIVWHKARGATIMDVDGNVYIDFSSGIAINNVGHCHPKVVKAINKQAKKLFNNYDFCHSIRYKLLEKLSEIAPITKPNNILLMTTGTSGIESSMKLARYYTGKREFLAFHGAFHGRSFGTMSVLGVSKYKKGFGLGINGTHFVPYGYCYRCAFEKKYPDCAMLCVRYIEKAINFESSCDICALLVEPIQGVAGYVVPPPEFLPELKKLCKKHGILLIADEIHTGFGRTGKMFAVEHSQIEPDILVVGKALSPAMPLSAVIANKNIMESWAPGSESSSWSGYPIACATALATIDVLLEEKLCENAVKIGEYVLRRLKEIQEKHEIIGDVRGKGLMIGVELVKNRKTKEPATNETKILEQQCFKRGLLTVTGGLYKNVWRLMPPLCIDQKLIDIGLNIFEDSLKVVEHSH